MQAVGYAHLHQQLQLTVVPLQLPAVVQRVTRIQQIGTTLAVPAAIAPAANDLLGHALFALKHEGINLALLAQALPKIPAEAFEDALRSTPNGIYIRKACYLREAFSGELLKQQAPVRGPFVDLFDPEHYITKPGERSSRWRVEFNGLGSLAYCATVERTPHIKALLDYDIPARAKAFMQSLAPIMMDRTINWAYLHETKDSFAIEREAPSEDKSRKFIQLLRQAHERQPLTEDYLVALQNATISNPYDMAGAFRHEQNHLAGALQGAAGVTYVPPPAELCRELMESLMHFANEDAARTDPLVAAGIISFGFVLLHPFMDGNGRLSRFLIHQTLCRAGALDNGLLLPVSVAMKRNERGYLQALQSFSRPVRDFWDVQWIDFGQLNFQFRGDAAVYRYWDATPCVAFTLEMAKHALEVELREETTFLACFDSVYKAVDEQFDVRGSELSNLVMMCLSNGGVVSRHRRKQFQYTVPAHVFDFIEQAARQALADQQSEVESIDDDAK
ncbi:Fic family protein [Pseudomonas sp. 2(2015)]|uniref:Fic family protein n=1 Tax=Pseudomonas sp. 2(2015) TaxID=1619950 RepID=UPI0005EAD866|nr:Fic family protein [Pseudomonas sp. 2(2015)]KJK18545.1 cell division protein Fic [Pseudomonas sp. 2(2015)]